MAFKASLSLFVRDSDAQNAFNYNDHLQQLKHAGYWKPRFAGWPLGGETRKRAHVRCVDGIPGSARSTSSDRSGLMLASNLGARYVDPDAVIFDKQVELKEDLRARFKRWSVHHLPGHHGASDVPKLPDSARPSASSARQSLPSRQGVGSGPIPHLRSPSESAVSEDPELVYGGAWTGAAGGPRAIRGTASWKLKRLPDLPKPVFFEKVAKGEKLLAAGRVPVVRRTEDETKPLRYVAHTRPYEKPWLGAEAEPVIYFDKH